MGTRSLLPCILLGGIELMHMIKKGQLKDSGNGQTPVDLFYSLIK